MTGVPTPRIALSLPPTCGRQDHRLLEESSGLDIEIQEGPDPIGGLLSPLPPGVVVDLLNNSSASDAKNALSAQRMEALLNLKNAADPFATGEDIPDVIQDAKLLLLHSSPLKGNHKDGHRQEALDLKDPLDEFNNSG